MPTIKSLSDRAAHTGLALAVGVLGCAGLPPWGWWPATIASFAAWALLIRRSNGRSRFWRSCGVGLGWFIPSTLWISAFSPPGFVATVVIFSAWYGLVGLLAGWLVPATGRWRPAASVMALPVLITIEEWARWHGPFGGVPVSVVSVSQAASPFAQASRLGGPLLVTLITALAGTSLAVVIGARRGRSDVPAEANGETRDGTPPAAATPKGSAGRSRTIAGAAGLAIVGFTIVLGAISPRGHSIGTLRVAIVQGGGEQGTLAIHTDATVPFRRAIEATQSIHEKVDLVLWPEDVVAVDMPLAQHPWFEEIAAEAKRLEAPILVGVVEGVSDTSFTNYSVVVNPDGTTGDRYDKVRRVPFGEYVPMRSVFAPFSELLPRRDQVPGTKPAVVNVGDTRAAIAISWEVFFPRRFREGLAHGGEVLMNPTNGSSYELTMVQTQQLASSRLRAIESGRYLLQAAPTGFSAIVDPSGRVLQRTDVSEQKVLIGTIERRTGSTIEARTGDLLPAAVASLVSVLLGVAALRRRSGG